MARKGSGARGRYPRCGAQRIESRQVLPRCSCALLSSARQRLRRDARPGERPVVGDAHLTRGAVGAGGVRADVEQEQRAHRDAQRAEEAGDRRSRGERRRHQQEAVPAGGRRRRRERVDGHARADGSQAAARPDHVVGDQSIAPGRCSAPARSARPGSMPLLIQSPVVVTRKSGVAASKSYRHAMVVAAEVGGRRRTGSSARSCRRCCRRSGATSCLPRRPAPARARPAHRPAAVRSSGIIAKLRLIVASRWSRLSSVASDGS